ncbi:MAG: response regulator transcription factor [Bacteroidales bacterium]|nr:response regulator transcription factor [Bacteroidales bacterium]
MKLKCIVIDDEPFAIKMIEDYCSKVPFLDLKASFNNPFEALTYLSYQKPDLIFLDIQMPEISGIQLAKKTENGPLIIFTTAHSKYAVDSYDLNAIDYLLKPFDFNRFFKAVQKAKEQIELREAKKTDDADSESIVIKVEYKNVKIRLDDILYIEALDNYIRVNTTDKKYLCLQNLKSISGILPSNKFLRIHKSYIVSLSKISHFTKDQINIDQISIPVGRTYADNFISIMKA